MRCRRPAKRTVVERSTRWLAWVAAVAALASCGHEASDLIVAFNLDLPDGASVPEPAYVWVAITPPDDAALRRSLCDLATVGDGIESAQVSVVQTRTSFPARVVATFGPPDVDEIRMAVGLTASRERSPKPEQGDLVGATEPFEWEICEDADDDCENRWEGGPPLSPFEGC